MVCYFVQTEASCRVEGSSDEECFWRCWRNLGAGLRQGGQQGRRWNLGGAAPLQTRVGRPAMLTSCASKENNVWNETRTLLMLPNTTSSPCLCYQHPFMCPHQPAHESVGKKVPSDQVPQVHLHHLHPKLPWPEPAHRLCLFGGRDEGSVHRPAGLWWHEPQSWRWELRSIHLQISN